MLSNSKAAFPIEDYSLGELLCDAAVGVIALVAIIALSLILGGFSFFEPWLIVGLPVMFAAGVLRGNSRGNIWVKVLFLNVGNLVFVACCANAPTIAPWNPDCRTSYRRRDLVSTSPLDESKEEIILPDR